MKPIPKITIPLSRYKSLLEERDSLKQQVQEQQSKIERLTYWTDRFEAENSSTYRQMYCQAQNENQRLQAENQRLVEVLEKIREQAHKDWADYIYRMADKALAERSK